MGGFKLTGLGTASAAADSARASQVQDNAYSQLSGVAGTDTITASALFAPTLAVGQQFTFAPAATNTGAATLNISSTGAGAIQLNGQALTGGELVSGIPVTVYVSAATPVYQILTQAAFLDSQPVAVGATDKTKRVRFEVDGLTTGTTRVITMPDANVTLQTFADQNANVVFSGPTSGAAAAPAFRALVAADMPRLTTIVAPTSLPVANSVDIDNIPQTFSYLMLVINGAATGTATRFTMVQVSIDNGASYDTTAGNYPGININDGTAAANDVASLVRPTAIGAAATATFSVVISGYQAGPLPAASSAGANGTGDFSTMTTYIGSTSAIDSLRILLNNTGNFSAGTYALYGMA